MGHMGDRVEVFEDDRNRSNRGLILVVSQPWNKQLQGQRISVSASKCFRQPGGVDADIDCKARRLGDDHHGARSDDLIAQLRRLTRETGTLLAIDETHTQVVGPGGLTAQWGLRPDLITIGNNSVAVIAQSIGGGGGYGGIAISTAVGGTNANADVTVGETSIGMEYEITDAGATAGTATVYARGTSVAVLVDYATMQKVRVPDAVRAAIAAL